MRLSQFLIETTNDKHLCKAVFVIGCPGSGKTTVAEKMFGGINPKFINSDTLFEEYLKKNKLPSVMNLKDKGMYRQQMSLRQKAINQSVKDKKQFMQGLLPIVIDNTGRNLESIKKHTKELQDAGYDVSLVYVDVSEETALRRNKLRPRQVDEVIIKSFWKHIKENAIELKNFFGNDFYTINNEADNGLNKKEMLDISQKIFKSSVKNPKGKEAIRVLQ